MADFMTDLWGSVFTPGPTPPLLLATNVAFAGLQVVLAVLLFATYSIHFIILSVLSAGLWWGINWFANEIVIAQAQEEAAKSKGSKQSSATRTLEDELANSGMDSGDDTETETPAASPPSKSLDSSTQDLRPANTSVLAVPGSRKDKGTSTAQYEAATDALRKRHSLSESTGSISTDSEWEKVENEK